jgi:hypothetical protein
MLSRASPYVEPKLFSGGVADPNRVRTAVALPMLQNLLVEVKWCCQPGI